MDRFKQIETFVAVAATGSLSAAAHAEGVAPAIIGRRLDALEERLGVKLLVRTTRALRTTPEGDAYYRRCLRITADVDELEASIRRAARHPSGPLRVDLPGPVASAIVLPALGTFHARHPDLVLMLGVSVRAADMVGDAVDCSVRLGDLPDSSFVARPLGALERVTCASPAYLDRCGVPRTLDDLDRHRAVGSTSGSGQRAAECDFMVDGGVRKIRLDVIVGVDDEHAYLACGVHGLGLIQPPRAVAQPLIDAGLLREVLPQWRPAAVPVSAVYVKRPHVSPGVRAFVDWIAERFEAAARERAAGVIGWEARWRAPERIDMPVEGVSAAIA